MKLVPCLPSSLKKSTTTLFSGASQSLRHGTEPLFYILTEPWTYNKKIQFEKVSAIWRKTNNDLTKARNILHHSPSHRTNLMEITFTWKSPRFALHEIQPNPVCFSTSEERANLCLQRAPHIKHLQLWQYLHKATTVVAPLFIWC